MGTCAACGGKLRRVHRTFWERFRYLAIYACRKCDRRIPAPRSHTFHFGGACRCPKCGTFRVVKLKTRDKIDPMYGGPLNWLERLSGGTLHHCCYCRVQFYDRRPLDPGAARSEVPEGFQREAAHLHVTPEQVAKARGKAKSAE